MEEGIIFVNIQNDEPYRPGYRVARCCGSCEKFLFKSYGVGEEEGRCSFDGRVAFEHFLCDRFEARPSLSAVRAG
jgi:hypothetical protein